MFDVRSTRVADARDASPSAVGVDRVDRPATGRSGRPELTAFGSRVLLEMALRLGVVVRCRECRSEALGCAWFDAGVMDPVPALEDLIWLFETEPIGRFPSEDWRREWPYGAVTFSTSRSGFEVAFYLEPASNLAGVVLRELGRISVRLDLDGVANVQVDRLHGDEDLVIAFNGARPGPLRLTLKPEMRLTWGTNDHWPPRHP